MDEKSESDDTWKLWYRFALSDCFCYIQLFIAIKCQNWHLCNSTLKQMAPLFFAFDKTTYQRLIPYHLADLQKCPPNKLEHLQKRFTVAINGGIGHAVALDETHEMCVNKDLKMAITRPTQSYLQKNSLFLRHRISVHKSLIYEIFLNLNMDGQPLFNVYTGKPAVKEREENIQAMMEEIDKAGLFTPSVQNNCRVLNAFNQAKATPEQSFDMLNLREI